MLQRRLDLCGCGKSVQEYGGAARAQCTERKCTERKGRLVLIEGGVSKARRVLGSPLVPERLLYADRHSIAGNPPRLRADH